VRGLLRAFTLFIVRRVVVLLPVSAGGSRQIVAHHAERIAAIARESCETKRQGVEVETAGTAA
jgi:hypothetical protein